MKISWRACAPNSESSSSSKVLDQSFARRKFRDSSDRTSSEDRSAGTTSSKPRRGCSRMTRTTVSLANSDAGLVQSVIKESHELLVREMNKVIVRS